MIFQNSFECLEKFDEDLQNGKRRSRGREKVQKDKIRMTNLQSIDEDDGEYYRQISDSKMWQF